MLPLSHPFLRADVLKLITSSRLTLVDSLGTLLVLGDVEEFTKSVRRVIDVVNFDKDQAISVFETTIRYSPLVYSTDFHEIT